MPNPLEVYDPLADQEVSILINLKPDNERREERTAMVTIGVPDQVPVFASGRLADLPALIDQAWVRYGTHQAQAPSTPTTIAVASVEDEDSDDGDDATPPLGVDDVEEAQVAPTPPAQGTQRQAPSAKESILSLF